MQDAHNSISSITVAWLDDCSLAKHQDNQVHSSQTIAARDYKVEMTLYYKVEMTLFIDEALNTVRSISEKCREDNKLF